MFNAPSPIRIAITTGEPAGVGPELTAQALAYGLAHRWPDVNFTVFGNQSLIAARAAAVGIDWAQLTADRITMTMHDQALAARCEAGRLNAANSGYTLALLDAAIDRTLAGEFDAMVTAPLQKSLLNEAGILPIPFTGHTEYLAYRTGTAHVVMLLAGEEKYRHRTLRVALATTHLPLKAVAVSLTPTAIMETLNIIDRDLRRYFCIPSPRIIVAGLNPHAGENGHLGHEEIDVILPALKQARHRGIDARGPYPADTLFQPHYLDEADCVLAMYHDQGLPVLKYATFGQGYNLTLGLPIVRTSVDHGTALELAGTGRADPGSFIAAIDAAIDITRCIASSRPKAQITPSKSR